MAVLNNGDKNARIKFRLNTITNKEIAKVISSVSDLEAGQTTQNAGGKTMLQIDGFKVYEKPSFVDYLRSGWAVSLVAAIDYTASNGDPNSRDSLHAMNSNNQYESALFNVGQVVAPYDSDLMFPVFGFGGVPRHCGINDVSHCFALNGNPSNPSIYGIENIVQTYRQTLSSISLAGPTLFAPLLKEFMAYV